MPTERRTNRLPRLLLSLSITALFALVVPARPATAAAPGEWPALRPGMWETSRTFDRPDASGRVPPEKRRDCVNPTEELQREHARLVALGCEVSASARAGDVYAYTAKCLVPGAPAASRSTLTVEGTDAYRLVIESEAGRETVVARRVGSCKE